MRRAARITPSLALIGSFAVAAGAAAAIPIYTNDMSSSSARGQLVRLGDGTCARGGAARALKVRLWRATRECQLRTPVVGGNLEIAVTARLLESTPPQLRSRVYVGAGLRSGGEDQYQLAVFPQKGSYQLRRVSGGQATLLANGKAGVVKGIGKPNKLRLQTLPGAAGDLRVTARVNGRQLASVVETAASAVELGGRFSTLAIGSNKAAKGAAGNFDDLKVGIPDPF